jgi:hypothetical protein
VSQLQFTLSWKCQSLSQSRNSCHRQVLSPISLLKVHPCCSMCQNFLLVLVALGLNSRPHACQASSLTLKPLYHPFFGLYFGDGVSWTICLGWLQTTILISASWVARIIGMSHQSLAPSFLRVNNIPLYINYIFLSIHVSIYNWVVYNSLTLMGLP